MASDGESEYGYDLSLEDEELLASLVDDVHAANNTQNAGVLDRYPTSTLAPSSFAHHAPKPSHGGPQGTPSLVGIARTRGVGAFFENTQPQSTTPLTTADGVAYPDCRSHLLL